MLKEGSMEPPYENHFPGEILNFLDEYYTYVFIPYSSKKIQKITFQNGGQMTDFCFASFQFRQKLRKNQNKTKQNFSKGIFQLN